MQRKGVSYDVGRVMAGNWRPVFDPQVVRRELEIVRDDLHCNAVRICGRDINRLVMAAGMALQLGLEVWLSPELWIKARRKRWRTLRERPWQPKAAGAVAGAANLAGRSGVDAELCGWPPRHDLPGHAVGAKKSFKAVADYYAR